MIDRPRDPAQQTAARAWQVLGVFWALVLLCGSGAAIWLQFRPVPVQHASETVPAATLEPVAPPPSLIAMPAPQPQPTLRPGRLPGADGSTAIADPDPALLDPPRPPAVIGLPRLSTDGRHAGMGVYARPFDRSDTRPRISLVLGGLGLAESDSRDAIARLPGEVSVVFSAYAENATPLLEAARARGHELLAAIPMESQGYPLNDAGYRSLLSGVPPEQNRETLDWALTRFAGYVGATAASDGLRGERFAQSGQGLDLVLQELGERGLVYLDPRPGAGRLPGVWSRAADVIVDEPASRAEIEAKLAQLERIAREKGSALGIAGTPRPVTVERLVEWTRGLAARGIALAPVTAVMLPP
jgi:polysaccharide deacetylase 2 family uncharacterized protein YibQ